MIFYGGCFFRILTCGVKIDHISYADFKLKYQSGLFILAYYPANRIYQAQITKQIENVELKDVYDIHEVPSVDFIKYLVSMKTREALAEKAGKFEVAQKITDWFDGFENLLRRIFNDNDLKLNFDIETFEFKIIQNNREPYSFNELSDGYAAIISIVSDLIMRMEKNASKIYDIEGIAIIDEIETHLHLELQKAILPMLTEIFTKIQFIVSTHSPFIINSITNENTLIEFLIGTTCFYHAVIVIT